MAQHVSSGFKSLLLSGQRDLEDVSICLLSLSYLICKIGTHLLGAVVTVKVSV